MKFLNFFGAKNISTAKLPITTYVAYFSRRVTSLSSYSNASRFRVFNISFFVNRFIVFAVRSKTQAAQQRQLTRDIFSKYFFVCIFFVIFH